MEAVKLWEFGAGALGQDRDILGAMRKTLAILLLSASAVAKTVHAPLPPEAYTAKTIAIVNHVGSQKLTDKAYEELQKWGHFTVVQDPASADVVLVLTKTRYSTGASAYTTGSNTSITEDSVTDVTTSFILKGQTDPFFSETERASLLRKSATQRGIDELKKRLDEKPTP